MGKIRLLHLKTHTKIRIWWAERYSPCVPPHTFWYLFWWKGKRIGWKMNQKMLSSMMDFQEHIHGLALVSFLESKEFFIKTSFQSLLSKDLFCFNEVQWQRQNYWLLLENQFDVRWWTDRKCLSSTCKLTQLSQLLIMDIIDDDYSISSSLRIRAPHDLCLLLAWCVYSFLKG